MLVLPCLLPLFSFAKGHIHKTYYGKEFHSPGEEEPGDQGKELTPELIRCWCFPASCLFIHQEKRNQGAKKRINSRVISLLVLPCLLPLFSFAKGNIHKIHYGKEFHSPGEEKPGDQGKRITSRVNSLLVLPCLLPLFSFAKGNVHKTYYGKEFHSPGEEEPGDQGKELTPELIRCWCFPASCLFIHQEKRNQGAKEKN